MLPLNTVGAPEHVLRASAIMAALVGGLLAGGGTWVFPVCAAGFELVDQHHKSLALLVTPVLLSSIPLTSAILLWSALVSSCTPGGPRRRSTSMATATAVAGNSRFSGQTTPVHLGRERQSQCTWIFICFQGVRTLKRTPRIVHQCVQRKQSRPLHRLVSPAEALGSPDSLPAPQARWASSFGSGWSRWRV